MLHTGAGAALASSARGKRGNSGEGLKGHKGNEGTGLPPLWGKAERACSAWRQEGSGVPH